MANWVRSATDFYGEEAHQKSNVRRHALFVNAYAVVGGRLGVHPGQKLLDLGCGCGEMTGALSSYDILVVGVDISEASLRVAKSFYPNSPFACADIAHLPFRDHSFDRATAISSVEFVCDKARAMSELARVLFRGGMAYLDVRNDSFILFSLLRPVRGLMIRIGLIEEYPAEGFRDLTFNEWMSLISLSDFRLANVIRSVWPWRFGKGLALVKNMIIAVVRLLPGTKRHYMVGFVLLTSDGVECGGTG